MLCLAVAASSASAQEVAPLKMSWSLDARRAIEAAALPDTPLPSPVTQIWLVAKGQTLKQVLSLWAAQADWAIEIDPDVEDERIGSHDRFSGSLYEGVRGLMGAIPRESPIGVNLWEGSKVMHVYVR